MTNQPKTKPFAPLGFVVLVAGLLAWVWLEDWRWAATGLAGFLVGVVLAGTSKTSAQALVKMGWTPPKDYAQRNPDILTARTTNEGRDR